MSIPDTLTIDREDMIMLAAIMNDTVFPSVKNAIMIIFAKHDLEMEDIEFLRKEARWEAEAIRQAKRETGITEH